MSIENLSGTPVADIASVTVKDRKGISMVWLLPIIAALIAGWLGYKAYAEKGPTVTISFKEATGVESGKTKIKYKDIELGTVRDVALSEVLSEVIVTADFGQEAKQHLNENTRFWVVRPRVGAAGISGLNTLFSGAYIQIEPGEGKPQAHFTGLEEPPVVAGSVEGRRFTLRTENLGSLQAGAPVYYRGMHAGEITGYDFNPGSGQLVLQAFVEAPFHSLVKETTRFWNVSGVEMQADADGFEIKTGSLQSLLTGGIAFDSFDDTSVKTSIAKAHSEFKLHERYSDASEQVYDRKIPYVMFFNGSVRGLHVGAPVEFRGFKLGTVTDVQIVEDPESLEIFIPVTIALEPERIPYLNGRQGDRSAEDVVNELVARGLKGQLQTGSLLTGQLYVDLEFYPKAKTRLAGIDYAYPELPTIPATFAEIKDTMTDLLADIHNLPLEGIAQNVLETAQGLSHLVNAPELQKVVQTTESALVQAEQTLATMDKTLVTVDEVIAPDSALQYDLANMIVEIKSAAQSIRVLTNYLERHPESLIAGKR